MNPHAFLQHFLDADTDKEHGLSARQMRVLGIVTDLPGEWGVRELASTLRVNKPSITRAVQRLTDEGLVVSKAVPLDRRLVRIIPTAAGRRLWSDAVRAGEKAAVRRAA